MHKEYPWESSIDAHTREIESLTRETTMDWLKSVKSDGLSDAEIYMLLAFASARYIDHHGPFIGHGTFNGGPVFRASALLSDEYKELALLQTALYVVDLLANPNYGPYLMMAMDPIEEATIEQSEQAFLTDVEDGGQILKAEHRLVGLLRQYGRDARWILTNAALRQYPKNEHRLLIVHRGMQFLDDVDGWAHAEPILRPAAQYLASRPDTTLMKRIEPDLVSWPMPGVASEEQVVDAMQRLVDASYGEEPFVIADLIRQGVSGRTLYEAIALTSSEMLRQSQFDAHAVTGVHCTLDLLLDSETPPAIRTLAGHLALSSQRTGRQKSDRLDWRTQLQGTGGQVTLNDVKDTVLTSFDEQMSAQVARDYLLTGGDPVELARTLMEISLTTAGPFDAIHNVKMIWGLLQETQQSQLSGLAWRHLSAGARVVAGTMETERANGEKVVSIWSGR